MPQRGRVSLSPTEPPTGDGFSGIRVVVVAHGPPLKGGITTVAMDLVEDQGLNERFEVLFQNTSQAQDKRGRFAMENIWRAISHAWQTFRLARRGSVVHTHSVQDPTFVAWRQVAIATAARARGARVLLHNHAFRPYMEPPGEYRIGRLHRAAFALLDRLAHANVLLAPEGLANLQPLMPRTPMPVVANSVVTSEIPVSDACHRPAVVLFVGELLERKGVLVLLDALDELHRRGATDFELRIVGNDALGLDPDKDAMITAIRERGHGSSLIGAVSRSEVFEHLSEADIFVFPTFVEGQPFALIEALAAGVPIVASNIPTVAGMITDPEHGRLVPPGDHEALADALDDLLADPARRREISARNRALAVAEYDRATFREALTALYLELGVPTGRRRNRWDSPEHRRVPAKEST